MRLIRKIDVSQELAREHAIAAHVDEALETRELYDWASEAGPNAGRIAAPMSGDGDPSGSVSELYDQDAEGGILGPICDEPFHLWQRVEICTVCGSVAVIAE